MAKKFVTDGGAIIEKSGFGEYKVNGKTAHPKEVQSFLKSQGKVYDLKNADRKTKHFAEMMEQRNKLRKV